MYQTSENFDKSIRGYSRTFLTKFEVSGKEIPAQVRSILYSASANQGDSVSIGGATSACTQITMVKPDVSLENQEFTLYLGLDLGDTQEFVKMGLFTAQKPQNDDGILTFTAYDRMTSKLSGAYFSKLSYPIDAKKVIEEIILLTDIEMNGMDELPDGVMIDPKAVATDCGENLDGEKITITTYQNPFDSYTYRETLGYIAQLYAKFAVINRDGAIEFRWYKEADYSIASSHYYDDLTTTEQMYVINRIICTTGEGSYTVGDGTSGMQITNPIMTQEHLNRIYEELEGFEFLPASLSFLGDPRLDLGDVVQVCDKYGALVPIPVMGMTQDFDGGLITAIASQGQTEAEANSGSQKGPTARALDRVYEDLLFVKNLVGEKANFDYVKAKTAELDEAIVGKLDADQADIKYAKIDFTNISKAAMEYFYAQSGLIREVTIGDATISGKLVGVTISGDLIEGNTIKAEKLVIRGEDGLYYKLNTNGMETTAEQTDYNSLNGRVLQAKSVTAEKISVTDLVALGATIGGFKIGEHSLHTAGKEEILSKVNGVYMDDDGQIAIGDGQNYIRYYKNADGQYKLAISVDELVIGSGSVGEELEQIRKDLNDQVETLKDEISTILRIESSRGTVFKNDQVSTVLSVVIYRGSKRITDAAALKEEFGDEAYIQWKWQRLDEESFGIISADDYRLSNEGFSFILSPDDVDTKITFMCELIA